MEKIRDLSEENYYRKHASEERFLAWYHSQQWPAYEKPSVTADMVVYSLVNGKLKLLLIRRATHPCKEKLSLVGGFVLSGEDAYDTCRREIRNEAGLELPFQHIEQLMTVSRPNRDPRGWVMTIAHLVYLPHRALEALRTGEDGREPLLVDVDFGEKVCRYQGQVLVAEDFAFDHYEIIQQSIQRIQGRMSWNPTFFRLLEAPFTTHAGTDLVNLIFPHKTLIHNNFLSKYGNYLEEVGLERIPKKKPRKTYRLKEDVR